MLEDKLSTDYKKNRLYDELLALADKEFDLIGQALILPADIRLYFDGEKEAETEAEVRRYQDLFVEWADKALKTIVASTEAHPASAAENLSRFVDALPQDIRRGVKNALFGAIAKQEESYG